MRFQKRTDRPVGADGTAPCDLCGQTVEVDPDGFCNLGHRVTSPASVAAAMDIHGGSPHAEPAGAEASWPPAPAPAPAPAPESLEGSTDEPVAVTALSSGDAAASAAAQPLPAPENSDDVTEIGGFDDLLDFEDLDRRSA